MQNRYQAAIVATSAAVLLVLLAQGAIAQKPQQDFQPAEIWHRGKRFTGGTNAGSSARGNAASRAPAKDSPEPAAENPRADLRLIKQPSADLDRFKSVAAEMLDAARRHADDGDFDRAFELLTWAGRLPLDWKPGEPSPGAMHQAFKALEAQQRARETAKLGAANQERADERQSPASPGDAAAPPFAEKSPNTSTSFAPSDPIDLRLATPTGPPPQETAVASDSVSDAKVASPPPTNHDVAGTLDTQQEPETASLAFDAPVAPAPGENIPGQASDTPPSLSPLVGIAGGFALCIVVLGVAHVVIRRQQAAAEREMQVELARVARTGRVYPTPPAKSPEEKSTTPSEMQSLAAPKPPAVPKPQTSPQPQSSLQSQTSPQPRVSRPRDDESRTALELDRDLADDPPPEITPPAGLAASDRSASRWEEDAILRQIFESNVEIRGRSGR